MTLALRVRREEERAGKDAPTHSPLFRRTGKELDEEAFLVFLSVSLFSSTEMETRKRALHLCASVFSVKG